MSSSPSGFKSCQLSRAKLLSITLNLIELISGIIMRLRSFVHVKPTIVESALFDTQFDESIRK